MFRHELGDGAELRILERRHAADFLTFIEENRAFLGTWLAWANSITTAEQASSFLQRGMTRFAEDGLPWIGIWQHDRMAGGILCFPLDQNIRSTEIGYWLGAQFSGKGLMSRALRAVLASLFAEHRLNRVGLQAEIDNRASRALAERLGFTLEGVRRAAWNNAGRYADMAAYSLLASEWAAQMAENSAA